MTFEEVRQAILDASWKGGMCEEYHSVKIASTWQELIDATITLFIYGWTKGIVNTTILDEVDDTLLMDNGIFYNKTGAITLPPANPKTWFDGLDIYIVGGDPSIEFTGVQKNRLIVVESNPTITVKDDAYLTIEAFNLQGTINAQDNSVLQATIENRTANSVTANIDSEASIFLDYKATLTLNIGSVGRAKLFSEKNSSTTVNLESSDLRIFAITSGKSSINYYVP